MKGNATTALFILFVCSFLIMSCAQGPSLESPGSGYRITGFVGTSASDPAVSETVLLLDGETGSLLNRGETNLAGKYVFSHLPPGRYVIRVGHITREVSLRDSGARLDIEWDDCPTCPPER